MGIEDLAVAALLISVKASQKLKIYYTNKQVLVETQLLRTVFLQMPAQLIVYKRPVLFTKNIFYTVVQIYRQVDPILLSVRCKNLGFPLSLLVKKIPSLVGINPHEL